MVVSSGERDAQNNILVFALLFLSSVLVLQLLFVFAVLCFLDWCENNQD